MKLFLNGTRRRRSLVSLEILVGLGGEPDDDVPGDGRIREDFEDPIREFKILLDGVSAIHQLENPIRSALHRNVEVSADPWASSPSPRARRPSEVLGITRQEANSEAVRGPHRGFSRAVSAKVVRFGSSTGLVPECRQTGADLGLLSTVQGHRHPMGVAVVIHGLPEQRHFDDARRRPAAAFLDDRVRRAVYLGPAGVGDDAVRTELVAATGDAHVGASDAGWSLDPDRRLERDPSVSRSSAAAAKGGRSAAGIASQGHSILDRSAAER